MNCIQFEEAFDRYVDDLLDPSEAAAARAHVKCCSGCDRSVSRWQQTRILLSTAVAEVATAVDVSSLSAQIHAALGSDFAQASTTARPARHDRDGATREASAPIARRAAKRSASRTFGAAWRFGAAASVSAAAAALVVVLLTPNAGTHMQVAKIPPLPEVPYVPVRLATGVDAIEAAPGHMVSTWVEPKTQARVIWVENRTPIESADYGR